MNKLTAIHREPGYFTTVEFEIADQSFAISHVGILGGIDTYCVNSPHTSFYEYIAADALVDFLSTNPHIVAALA